MEGEMIGEETTGVGEKFGAIGQGNSLNGGMVQGIENDTVTTASSSSQVSSSSDVSQVYSGNGSYKISQVKDAETGMTIARCYAPEDYSVEGTAIWCGKWQSFSAPVQAYVTACSADGNTAMGFYSLACYEHILEYSQNGIALREQQDGVFDTGSMLPMLSFMTSDAYCDYIAQTILPNQTLYLKAQAEITDSQQNLMDTLANELYQTTYQMIGNQYSIDGTYYGMAERTYSLELDGTPYTLTVSTATDGVQFSSSVDFVYNMGTANATFISWESPFVFFILTPESEYEKNYSIYELFVLNTGVSDEFVSALTRLSQQLTQQMVGQSSASMDAVSDYCKSSMSSEVGSDASYSDERFTDYIYSQNDYTLSNGDHVKVPTSYDYVYADDNGNVYATNSTDEPAGMERLYPNQ